MQSPEPPVNGGLHKGVPYAVSQLESYLQSTSSSMYPGSLSRRGDDDDDDDSPAPTNGETDYSFGNGTGTGMI